MPATAAPTASPNRRAREIGNPAPTMWVVELTAHTFVGDNIGGWPDAVHRCLKDTA